MSNASFKEQLQAVASQLTDKMTDKPANHQPERKIQPKIQPKLQPKIQPKAKEKVSERQRPKWLDYVQYGVELLRVYFPECFKTPNEVKPLKKGIKQDLIKRLSAIETIVTEDKACMIKSLTYYVNTAAYHKSMQEGTNRIDLDGNPEGIVTAEEAKYSLERQQAKLLARQNAKSGTK
jgi:ProP effector